MTQKHGVRDDGAFMSEVCKEEGDLMSDQVRLQLPRLQTSAAASFIPLTAASLRSHNTPRMVRPEGRQTGRDKKGQRRR